MEMIFHSYANKNHFHKKGCALDLILKARVFGTRKWPIDKIGAPNENIIQNHLNIVLFNVF